MGEPELAGFRTACRTLSARYRAAKRRARRALSAPVTLPEAAESCREVCEPGAVAFIGGAHRPMLPTGLGSCPQALTAAVEGAGRQWRRRTCAQAIEKMAVTIGCLTAVARRAKISMAATGATVPASYIVSLTPPVAAFVLFLRGLAHTRAGCGVPVASL